VFSAPALIFKGPGFHINDYRKVPRPADTDGKASAKTPTDADKSTPSATSTGKGASKGSSKGSSKDSSKDSSPASGSGGDSKAS